MEEGGHAVDENVVEEVEEDNFQSRRTIFNWAKKENIELQESWGCCIGKVMGVCVSLDVVTGND
jgi:hypothetical protein